MAGSLGFAAVAWAYLGLVAARMGDMSSVFAIPMTAAWSATQVALMVTMWAVMMAAMMLPSAIPMVIAYDRMDRASPQATRGSVPWFVVGYIVVWVTFAVAAAGMQWFLHDMALVDGMGVVAGTGLAGLLLVGAGLFQFTPLKRASLGACRTPMGFLITSWQDGKDGALRMGLHHGLLCLGCCWALMALLFVLGVMNLAWVAALAGFVLAEKVLPRGEVTSAVGGVLMIGWGFATLAGG